MKSIRTESAGVYVLPPVAPNFTLFQWGPFEPGRRVHAVRVLGTLDSGAIPGVCYLTVAVGASAPEGAGDFAAQRLLTGRLPTYHTAGTYFDIPLDFVTTESERCVTLRYEDAGGNVAGFVALVVDPARGAE